MIFLQTATFKGKRAKVNVGRGLGWQKNLQPWIRWMNMGDLWSIKTIFISFKTLFLTHTEQIFVRFRCILSLLLNAPSTACWNSQTLDSLRVNIICYLYLLDTLGYVGFVFFVRVRGTPGRLTNLTTRNCFLKILEIDWVDDILCQEWCAGHQDRCSIISRVVKKEKNIDI